MRLYVSTSDRYPLRYVDVVELFLGEQAARGIEQTWYVQATGESAPMRTEDVRGTKVIVPPVVNRGGLAGKLLTKMLYWGIDTALMVRQLWRPSDMIMVRDKYWAALLAVLIGRLRGIPVILWMSYPFPEDDLDRSRTVRQPLSAMLFISSIWGKLVYYGLAARNADHCFVQSDRFRQEMHERGVPLERLTAVPMGVPRRFVDEADREEAPPLKSPPVMLYVGMLNAVRRLEILITSLDEVLKRRPDVILEVVGGSGDPHDMSRLEELAVQRGVRDHVVFTGHLPAAEARRHILQATVCLAPCPATSSLRVASPTKLVEYLSLRKPTVCNSHPDQSIVSEASQGALCVPWSSTAFAEAIVWCIEHPEQAVAMAERGRAWVLANRTYDQLGAFVHDEIVSVRDRHMAQKTPPRRNG